MIRHPSSNLTPSAKQPGCEAAWLISSKACLHLKLSESIAAKAWLHLDHISGKAWLHLKKAWLDFEKSLASSEKSLASSQRKPGFI